MTSSTISTHMLTNKMLSEVSRSNTRKYSPDNDYEIQYVGEPMEKELPGHINLTAEELYAEGEVS